MTYFMHRNDLLQIVNEFLKVTNSIVYDLSGFRVLNISTIGKNFLDQSNDSPSQFHSHTKYRKHSRISKRVHQNTKVYVDSSSSIHFLVHFLRTMSFSHYNATCVLSF